MSVAILEETQLMMENVSELSDLQLRRLQWGTEFVWWPGPLGAVVVDLASWERQLGLNFLRTELVGT